MQDLQQTLNQVLDYVKGIWIKKRYVMVCSWLICPIGFLYVASIPDSYQAKAVVFVDTRSVLQPLLRGLAFQTNPDQEVQMMAKTLLSRSNVETIARNADLDLNASNDQAFENLVTSLSKQIKLSGTGRNNIYTISYGHGNPATAQRVVKETLDLFMEGSLGGNRRDTDTAERFLNEQIAEYENRLAEAEQRVANFKRQYNDILPLAGSFFSSLQSLKQEREATQLVIRQTQRQAESLKGQLTRSRGADEFSVGGADEPVLRTRYDARIKSLEEELDRLRLRFTDLHPDVIEAQTLLASLEQARKRELEAFFSAGDSENGQPIGELNREITLEISRLESQVASLRVKEQDLNTKIGALEAKVDLIPQIEAESTALNRDYGITKRKYEELLSRRESADLSRRADVSAEELKFRILEPPLLPTAPVKSKRPIFMSAVLLVGFGAGIALAFLFSQLSPVLMRARQLTQITNYPVWGSVTHLHIEQIRKTNQYRLALFILSSGVILAMYAGLMAAEFMNIKVLQGLL